MLSGRLVHLRAIEEEDLPLMVGWRNSSDVYEFFYEYEPLSLAQQREWFESQRKNRSERNFIISLHNGQAIGTVSIYHIDSRNRKAEWGRLLIGDPKYIGKGIGTEVEFLVIQYAFDHLNLNRLYCEVLCSNANVIRQHEKFGFKVEGTIRSQVFKNGVYEDAVLMSLLSDEYVSINDSGAYMSIRSRIDHARNSGKETSIGGSHEQNMTIE